MQNVWHDVSGQGQACRMFSLASCVPSTALPTLELLPGSFAFMCLSAWSMRAKSGLKSALGASIWELRSLS